MFLFVALVLSIPKCWAADQCQFWIMGQYAPRPPFLAAMCGVDVPFSLLFEFHFNLLRLLCGNFWNGDSQYAILEFAFDVVLVDTFRKGEASLEASAGPFTNNVVRFSL